jgi:hypothetical protein
MCSSCIEKERSYKGELFIKLISFGPELFDWEDESGQTIAEIMESIKDLDTLDYEEKQLKEYYEFVMKNQLLDKSKFLVIFDDDFTDIHAVYANKSDFLKLDTFKLKTLLDQNQKIYVSFTGQQIAENVIVCKKIENVEKVDGETRWQK